jgi:hypothetical protein
MIHFTQTATLTLLAGALGTTALAQKTPSSTTTPYSAAGKQVQVYTTARNTD